MQNQDKRTENVQVPVTPQPNWTFVNQGIPPYATPINGFVPQSTQPVFPTYYVPQSPKYYEGDDKQESKEQLIPKQQECSSEIEHGTTGNFVAGLLFGTVFPVFSWILVWGMETTKLTRLGVLFGTADFFLICAMGAVKMFVHAEEHRFIILGVGIALLVLSLILLIVGTKKSFCFLMSFESSGKKMIINSEVGARRSKCISFVLSFFFSFVGAGLRVVFSRSLMSRFGTLKGFGFHLLVVGAVMPCNHLPVALLGLYIIQISNIHFRMALISAGESLASLCCFKRCATKCQVQNLQKQCCKMTQNI